MIKGHEIVQIASYHLYIKYRLGAETSRDIHYPAELDCSEFIEHSLRIIGYIMPDGRAFPDGSWLQYEVCDPKISVDEAMHYAGALVFNRGTGSGKIDHVGISTGTGCTIEAVSAKSNLPGSGMVNIFRWRPLWDVAGLIPGVEYERWS